MTATFPGYVPPADVVIDAGVLYTGSGAATPFGATRDGFTFDPGEETRQIPFDGGHSRMQLLDRITARNSMFKGKFLTITPGNILKYNPGSSSDGSSGTNTITMKKAGVLFAAGDYISHLYLIGRQQAEGTLMRIHFALALCAKYQIVTKHNDEWIVDGQFDAVLPTGSDPQLCPYTYEFLS